MNLAQLLRAGGLKVTEVPGWPTWVRPGSWMPGFAVVHHTAGHKDLQVVIHGRPDLAGPLADLYFPRSEDVDVYVVSGGRANHAGAGSNIVLREVLADIAPPNTAAARKLVDGPVGNGLSYGSECENLGDGIDPWPERQLNNIALAHAILCRQHSWSHARVIGHLEWTARKIDPRGFPMSQMRLKVAYLLGTVGPIPAPQPSPVTWGQPTEIDMTLTPVDVTIGPLDDQGRGNVTVPVTWSKIISALGTGIRPNVDGRYLVDSVGLAAEGSSTVVSVEDWDPKGTVTVRLWVAG